LTCLTLVRMPTDVRQRAASTIISRKLWLLRAMTRMLKWYHHPADVTYFLMYLIPLLITVPSEFRHDLWAAEKRTRIGVMLRIAQKFENMFGCFDTDQYEQRTSRTCRRRIARRSALRQHVINNSGRSVW